MTAPYTYNTITADVAQLVELLTVTQVVAGSNPVVRPRLRSQSTIHSIER